MGSFIDEVAFIPPKFGVQFGLFLFVWPQLIFTISDQQIVIQFHRAWINRSTFLGKTLILCCNILNTKLVFFARLEKYRPNRFEDIVGNEEVIERFEHFSVHGNIPNFILAGPPGVGKTTVGVESSSFQYILFTLIYLLYRLYCAWLNSSWVTTLKMLLLS